MGRRKYIKRHKKITIEEFYVNFQWFCIFYLCLDILVFVLGLMSKINDNVFFQWCGILSVFLSFPKSQSDLFIMVLGLHWLVFSLGAVFAGYKLYKTFNS